MKILFLTISVFTGQSIAQYSLSVSDSKVVNLGDSIELECAVKDVKEYSVSWSKKNDNISTPISVGLQIVEDDEHYSVSRKSNRAYSLTIHDARLSDIGFYECKALVSPGKQEIGFVEVNVRHPPTILKTSSESTVVTLGQNAILECHATGYPKPDYYWSFTRDTIDKDYTKGIPFYNRTLVVR